MKISFRKYTDSGRLYEEIIKLISDCTNYQLALLLSSRYRYKMDLARKVEILQDKYQSLQDENARREKLLSIKEKDDLIQRVKEREFIKQTLSEYVGCKELNLYRPQLLLHMEDCLKF